MTDRTVGLSDFTLVTGMDQLVQHLWVSGSERTDWFGLGLTYERSDGWKITDVRIDPGRERVTISFMKVLTDG